MPDLERWQVIENKRSTLLASLFNRISDASVTVAFLTPTIGFLLQSMEINGRQLAGMGLMTICQACLFHWSARWVIGSLHV